MTKLTGRWWHTKARPIPFRARYVLYCRILRLANGPIGNGLVREYMPDVQAEIDRRTPELARYNRRYFFGRLYREPPTCDCADCQSMCLTPCAPTPTEARRLIQAGHGHRLRLDESYYVPGDDFVFYLAMKRNDNSSCTFFDGKHCKLHGTTLKPLEARLATHDGTVFNRDKDLYPLWQTDAAQDLINEWKSAYDR